MAAAGATVHPEPDVRGTACAPRPMRHRRYRSVFDDVFLCVRWLGCAGAYGYHCSKCVGLCEPVWTCFNFLGSAGAGAALDAFAMLGKTVVGGALVGSKAMLGTTLKVPNMLASDRARLASRS